MQVVYAHMPPTPQYTWPLLNQRLGTEVWLKHENHSPVGAFKLRGALVYMDWLKKITARARRCGGGDAGQSRPGCGNGSAAAWIEGPDRGSTWEQQGEEPRDGCAGRGADCARRTTFRRRSSLPQEIAAEYGYAKVESFHERLVMGTANLRQGVPRRSAFAGQGLCADRAGIVDLRHGSGAQRSRALKTEIVGIVSRASPSYSLSFKQHVVVEAPAETKIADGLACRKPNAQAMEFIWKNVCRIVEVSDGERLPRRCGRSM
jgi:threonine dehydratase